MYYDGISVPRDYVEAENWFRKAADQGHVGAQINLEMMNRKDRCAADQLIWTQLPRYSHVENYRLAADDFRESDLWFGVRISCDNTCLGRLSGFDVVLHATFYLG